MKKPNSLQSVRGRKAKQQPWLHRSLILLIDSVQGASDAAQPFQLSIVNTRSNKSDLRVDVCVKFGGVNLWVTIFRYVLNFFGML